MQAILVIVFALLLGGCATVADHHMPAPDDPDYAPIVPAEPTEPLVATGSLFRERSSNGLFSDIKARQVGDIITVILQEQTQASKTAKTETKKENDYSVDPLVGPGGNVIFNGNNLQLGVKSAGKFKGDAKADQSNSLSGQIAVTVLRVLSNGNLVIRGEKWLTLNEGEEYIRLTGIIRAEDIKADNTIESFKVANARIQYSGTGDLKDVQRPGWLARFFLNPVWWPF